LRNKENPGPYTVAKFIEVGSVEKNNFKRFDLCELNSDNIRKVAAAFGCKGVSSATMFDCRFKMALRKTSGTSSDNLAIPNPVCAAGERKINTHLRVLNTVFSATFINDFIKLNDNKSRNDFEAVSGASPFKTFWEDVSNRVNDTESDDGITNILFTGEEGNTTLKGLVASSNYSLADFNQVDWKTCCVICKGAFKALDKIRVAMKQSGFHCTDTWQYCRKSHLKVRKNVEVPAIVAFYLSLLTVEHPGIDGTFSQCLDDNLRSDSTTSPADLVTASSGISTKSKAAESTAFLKTFEKVTNEMQFNQRSDMENRQKLIKQQYEDAKEKAMERQWSEYDKLSARVLGLKKDIRRAKETDNEVECDDCRRYLKNLSVRVRIVEIELEIEAEDSIVREFLPEPVQEQEPESEESEEEEEEH
jgi:hypothetical protein